VDLVLGCGQLTLEQEGAGEGLGSVTLLCKIPSKAVRTYLTRDAALGKKDLECVRKID
jgi:hypothetical protein